MLRDTIDNYDPNIAKIFLPWAWRHPRYLKSFLFLRKSYLKTELIRDEHKSNNLKIPPFLIISITHHCNLHCDQCYAYATGTVRNNNDVSSLQFQNWIEIIKDANKNGVFGFVLAGGEPFLYPDLLKIPSIFPYCFFIIITNGTLCSESHMKELKQLGNVAVLVSDEGGKDLTDERRGEGIYDVSKKTLKSLNQIGVINGVSVTLTKNNYEYWIKPENIDNLINQGVRIGVFIEYIPLSCRKEDLQRMLSLEQRRHFRDYILKVREEKKMYVVHSPGDEEFFGGCVSAGRGFAHVSPSGDVTPCPICNVATHNLTRSSFLDAMKSQLFIKIRENGHLLETEGFPCALFAHPEEVENIAQQVGAYRTVEKVED